MTNQGAYANWVDDYSVWVIVWSILVVGKKQMNRIIDNKKTLILTPK